MTTAGAARQGFLPTSPARRYRRCTLATERFRDTNNELFQRLRVGDQAALDAIVRLNSRLVHTCAGLYVRRTQTLPFDDLVQEGFVGLLRAAQDFDPDRGISFSTYAVWWIHQAMGRAIRTQALVIDLPEYVWDRMRAVGRAVDALTQAYGRPPSGAEIAAHTGLPDATVALTLEALRTQPTSLDRPVRNAHPGMEGDATLGDYIRDPAPAPDVQALDRADAHTLDLLLDHLPARDRAILVARVGRGHSLREIGDAHGLTHERVRQIVARGLALLRFHAAARGEPAEFRAELAPDEAPRRPALPWPATFRAYVTGPENALAYNTALGAARGMHAGYLLSIVGPAGSGKSHLLMAAEAVARRHATVVCATAHEFVRDFAAAVRAGALADFRRRYTRAALLLLDDLSMLAGSPAAAGECARAIAAVRDAGGCVLVADRRAPAACMDLSPALRAALSEALVARVKPLGRATRAALVDRAVERQLPALGAAARRSIVARTTEGGDVAVFLAEIDPLYQQGTEEVERALADGARLGRGPRERRNAADADAVLAAVCGAYGLRLADLLSKSREMPLARARQVAMYLLREEVALTATRAGLALGRDHSTVLHGHGRVARALTEGDPVVTAFVTRARGLLRAGMSVPGTAFHSDAPRLAPITRRKASA